MSRFKRYYTALFRLKRSKGYGIHSPFAFHFVIRVLRERNPFYAYEHIDKSRRLLFRVACNFKPDKILLIGAEKKTETAVHNYSKACVVCKDDYNEYQRKASGNLMFIVVDAVNDVVELQDVLKRAIDQEVVVVFHNLNKNSALKTIWLEMNKSLKCGMSFTNYKTGIVVVRKHLPRQNFTLWF